MIFSLARRRVNFDDYFERECHLKKVIVNCGFMTLSKPPPFVENVLEHVFMTIYTLECIVKIIARGFFVDQMSYVRDPWNLVDLFVVGLGYIMQIIDLVSPYIMKATQEKLYD